MKLGVIDIGTLKVKLLIAENKKSKEIKSLYASNTLTCLGVRMHENNNKPWPNYLDDTIKELKRCKNLLEKENVKKLRVVSTHALREMGKIGIEVAEKIRKEVGLKVEIISQTEEANLFFKAVLDDFSVNKDFTLVDVGGGSVQVLIGNRNKLKDMHLLKTGAQYLFDNFSPRHTGNDFPTRDEIRKMQKYVMHELVPIRSNLKTPVIYGSSCIIDLFRTMGVSMGNFPYSKSNPFKTDIGELEGFLDRIVPVPYDKREEMYKFKQKYYMWGIDKALINIISISKKVNSPYVVPTNSNINQGLVMSLI